MLVTPLFYHTHTLILMTPMYCKNFWKIFLWKFLGIGVSLRLEAFFIRTSYEKRFLVGKGG